MPLDLALKIVLEELARDLSLGEIELDEDDGCALCFEHRMTVNLQYRHDEDVFFFYADLGAPSTRENLYKELLRHNLFWQTTKGATFSLSNGDPAHVLLAQSFRWRGKTGVEFARMIENFANVAQDWSDLFAAPQQPAPPMPIGSAMEVLIRV